MTDICTMTREEFIAPHVLSDGRRCYTGLQIASSPTLRRFINDHPQWFEVGPVNMDIVLIREAPDGTTWVELSGNGTAPHLKTDEDGLPYAGFKAIGEHRDVYVSDGRQQGYKRIDNARSQLRSPAKRT